MHSLTVTSHGPCSDCTSSLGLTVVINFDYTDKITTIIIIVIIIIIVTHHYRYHHYHHYL